MIWQISKQQKSAAGMSVIKSKDTRPEVFVRKLLFSHGYRYRKYSTKIPGHPDIWMRKYNTAIFVNGCFWHRHEGCKYAYTPKSKIEFWTTKFDNNKRRDKTVYNALSSKGIKCLIIWECSVKKAKKDSSSNESLLQDIEIFLNSPLLYHEI